MPASSTVRGLFEVGPARRDHVPALRIALAVGLPLVLLMALGRPDLTIYAAFGAFTSIYARHEPLRERLTHEVQAGALVTAAVGIGAVLSALDAPEPAVLAITAMVAAVGAVLAAAWNLKPAGSVFFIFATGAIGSLGPDAVAHPLAAIGIAAGSAALSVLLAWAWSLVGEGHPEKSPAPAPPAARLTRGQLAAHGGRFLAATGLAAVVALAVAEAAGLSHVYWAQVAAAAPIAAPTHLARLQRGIHRMVGTLGGVGVAAFVLAFELGPWQMLFLVIVFQLLAELFVGRNYSIALLFITPLALLMTQLAHPVPSAPLLEARAVETVVGALCGMLVIYFWRSDEERRADTQAMPVILQREEGDAGRAG
ncbi:FUSC family protein [Kocuria palustris]|uniref:FUSC family protein n=1 Tax=Kocuria palustris TaxID=71999 RepID=UPI0011A85138|nr:FUSC family protein [Kocuria palustris]